MKGISENLRKAAVTAAALAAVVGLVQLMRAGAQSFAAGFSGEARPQPGTVTEPMTMAKAVDVAAAVPADLAMNMCGMTLRSTEARLDMPLEMARKVDDDTARAAGWEPLDMGLATEMAKDLSGTRLYRRPDGTLVRRRHTPLEGGGTLREDFEIPTDGVDAGETAEVNFRELATRRSRSIRDRLPAFARELSVGDPIYTQLVKRGTGSAFFVLELASADEAATTLLARAAAARAGWRPEPRLGLGWVRENLTAAVRISRTGAQGDLLVSWRFADDDSLAWERLERENARQQKGNKRK